MKTIAIGSDHAGYLLKNEVINYLQELGFETKDFGTNSEDSCDYPVYAHKVSEFVEATPEVQGVLICGSGNGISIAANKHQGIRAALCWTSEIAELARLHNDANILSIPARFVSSEEAKAIVSTFFSTSFEGGRHQKRVDKIPV